MSGAPVATHRGPAQPAPGNMAVSAQAETIFEARGINLRFGGVQALTDVSFGIRKGELFSIIGPNGAGKTSMVNCISGRYKPTDGKVFFKGRDVTGMTPNHRASLGIGRTFQNLALFGHMTVLDNIMVGRHHLLKNNFFTGSLYWLTGARKEELAHRREVEEIAVRELRARLTNISGGDTLDRLATQVAAGELDPYAAADDLIGPG